MLRTRTAAVALAASVVMSLTTVASGAGPAGATATVTTSSAATALQPRVRPQRGTLRMLPQIAATGGTPQAAGAARSAMVATFKPGVRGRSVTLQRKQGRRWVKVAGDRQTRAGVVEFTAPYAFKRRAAVYRAMASGSRRPASATRAVSTNVGAPDFTDEFSGTALSGTWSDRGLDYNPAGNRTCSKGDPRARSVGGGTLQLKVIGDPDKPRTVLDPGCAYDGETYRWRLNGHVSTQGKKSFRYGYFAARVKFQPSRGQHGAFWMQPQDPNDGNGGAEVDVIEYFGNGHPQGGLTSFIYHDGNQYPQGFLPRPARFGKAWAEQFHVFSVEWTPRHYVFRIDGKQTLRVTRGVSNTPEYMILSNLSSDYELPFLGDERKLGTAATTMQVDWVRHWGL